MSLSVSEDRSLWIRKRALTRHQIGLVPSSWTSQCFKVRESLLCKSFCRWYFIWHLDRLRQICCTVVRCLYCMFLSVFRHLGPFRLWPLWMLLYVFLGAHMHPFSRKRLGPRACVWSLKTSQKIVFFSDCRENAHTFLQCGRILMASGPHQRVHFLSSLF